MSCLSVSTYMLRSRVIIDFYHIRNQAYHARIQLAVLDYNSYLDREKAKNREGGVIYAWKFRKQTKKWNVTPLMNNKKYTYIPELLRDRGNENCYFLLY